MHREYYQPERRAAAACVHAQLECVDWEAAVRRGVASAVVRGFNAQSVQSQLDQRTVRSVVRERIVYGLNRAAEGVQPELLGRFEQLVAEGVEDAVVEAFNQVEVLSGDPANVGHASPAAERTHAGPVAAHYGGRLQEKDFTNRYSEARLVSAGWVIGSNTIRPLSGGEFLLLKIASAPDMVEVWQDHVLVFRNCRYTEYYEDAQQLASNVHGGR